MNNSRKEVIICGFTCELRGLIERPEVQKRVTGTFRDFGTRREERAVIVCVVGRITDARAEVEEEEEGEREREGGEALKRETRNGRKEWWNVGK